MAVGRPWAQWLAFGFGSRILPVFVRLRVEGRERCPRQGPFLLAANHVSHFDPPMLTWALGNWIDWVAMVELYRHPWAARCWDAFGAIPVDRSRLDRRAAATVLRRLHGGRVVGIFPEGGIRKGALSVLEGGPLDAGTCRLALAARVPVVPVTIQGTEQMYSASGWLFPRRAFHVVVRFGSPLPMAGGLRSDKAAADALSGRLAESLRALTGSPSNGG